MIDQSPGADRDRCRSWPHMATIALRNNFQPEEHLRRQRKTIVAADARQNEQKRPENPAKVNGAKKAMGGLEALGTGFPGIQIRKAQQTATVRTRRHTPLHNRPVGSTGYLTRPYSGASA